MKCKQCGKGMTINLKFGISEFMCECGYQTDEMAILNEELQYLRKIKDDYIDSDKALEITKLTAKFASDLMMASYFNLMQKQISEKPTTGVSVKIENSLYSERQTNTAHLRQITELTKKLNDDFDKKIKELKKHHIEEIKEATKKARKRQTNTLIDLVTESKKTDTKLASLQDQLEYQSSMASLFAKKLQKVWNMQDDIIDKINNNSEDDYITIESFVKKLQKVKNIIPSECDKWDKKKSTAYLFEYVSRLMEKGYQILIKQDCTLKNYDYKIELYPEGVCYVFDFSNISDTDNEFIVLWEQL